MKRVTNREYLDYLMIVGKISKGDIRGFEKIERIIDEGLDLKTYFRLWEDMFFNFEDKATFLRILYNILDKNIDNVNMFLKQLEIDLNKYKTYEYNDGEIMLREFGANVNKVLKKFRKLETKDKLQRMELAIRIMLCPGVINYHGLYWPFYSNYGLNFSIYKNNNDKCKEDIGLMVYKNGDIIIHEFEEDKNKNNKNILRNIWSVVKENIDTCDYIVMAQDLSNDNYKRFIDYLYGM